MRMKIEICITVVPTDYNPVLSKKIEVDDDVYLPALGANNINLGQIDELTNKYIDSIKDIYKDN